MLILLNKYSNNGHGIRKWALIENEVINRVKNMGHEVAIEDSQIDPLELIKEYVSKGEKVFIAAGGDGSVHILANALMKLPNEQRKGLTLGAIGLGSSNDFHKPMSEDSKINGVPVKLNFLDPITHNTGFVEFVTENGDKKSEWFVINSSMGILAEGNDLFNKGDAVISFLKQRWVEGTISYSAAKTMFTYRNYKAKLIINGAESYETMLSNLSVVINPHFTGSLKYDTPVCPQSDHMCVNLCDGMGKLRQFITFYHMGNGRFLGLAQTKTWDASSVEIIPEKPVAFEMDGEVTRTSKVSIKLIKDGLNTCR
jgi:diacylglycerol kinase family enzyme